VYWAAGARMVFEIVNIFWPRATDQPWYLQYGIMLMVGAVGLLGVLAWLGGRDKIAQADLALHSLDEEGVGESDRPVEINDRQRVDVVTR